MLLRQAVAVLLMLIAAGTRSASALPIKEFRKFPSSDQGTYIVAAVSMLAYSYAANGNPAKARCIQNWYFGKSGGASPGPREVEIELGVAEHLDPAKYHVEGVVLGVADKACAAK